MALSYDVTKNPNAFREISQEEYMNEMDKRSIIQCPKFEEKGKYYQMTTECNMLIFIMGLIIGIPELNKDNYEWVFNRINVLEEIQGSYLVSCNPVTKQKEQNPFTIDMVKRNIGITTNGTILTRSDFEKKIVKVAIKDRAV